MSALRLAVVAATLLATVQAQAADKVIFATNWKAQAATYSTCPQCHQPKLPHRVCANCGYYGGRQAIEVE